VLRAAAERGEKGFSQSWKMPSSIIHGNRKPTRKATSGHRDQRATIVTRLQKKRAATQALRILEMIIADTDVLIDFLCGQGTGADRVALELQHGALSTTAITRFELLSSHASAKNLRQIHLLLECLPCLGLDSESADRAAQVRRTLGVSGKEIGWVTA
jgi:predicted nucleic acid-binding protein